jgi:hypothetical protein
LHECGRINLFPDGGISDFDFLIFPRFLFFVFAGVGAECGAEMFFEVEGDGDQAGDGDVEEGVAVVAGLFPLGAWRLLPAGSAAGNRNNSGRISRCIGYRF